jgi:exonuclease VII small subunit
MPQARRSTSKGSPSRFKQPAALKRLTTSLDTAQKAIADLRKQGGRDVGRGATDLYGDLRTFVSNARRDSNKLAKALQREFDQAQKQLAKAAKGQRATTGRSTSSRATSKRGTSSRGTSSRSTSSRSTSARSTSSRSTSGRSTSRGTSTGGTRRSTSSSRRTRKS